MTGWKETWGESSFKPIYAVRYALHSRNRSWSVSFLNSFLASVTSFKELLLAICAEPGETPDRVEELRDWLEHQREVNIPSVTWSKEEALESNVGSAENLGFYHSIPHEGQNQDLEREKEGVKIRGKGLLSEKQIDMLCYFLCNFSMSLHLLLLKEHKEKDVDSSAWIEQYEDILGRPITQWPLERKQEQEQLVHALGEDKAQRELEEILYFLIFHIVNNCCGPYVSKRELIRLLDRFYKVAFTEWLPICPDRDSYNKYAGARNPLEKFSIDLAIILDENIFTGARMASVASMVAGDIKSVIDKFFKEPHQFGLN